MWRLLLSGSGLQVTEVSNLVEKELVFKSNYFFTTEIGNELQ